MVPKETKLDIAVGGLAGNTSSCLKGLCFISIRTQKSAADASERTGM